MNKTGERTMNTGQPFNPYKMFRGSYIPNAIMECTTLTASAKLVWARLAQHSGKDGRAYPSHETLAKETGLSAGSVRKPLRLLIDQKFIKAVYPTGQDRLMHKNVHYLFLWHDTLAQSAVYPQVQSATCPQVQCNIRESSLNELSSNEDKRKNDDTQKVYENPANYNLDNDIPSQAAISDASFSDAGQLEEVRRVWNEAAAASGLKRMEKWTPFRKSQLRARLQNKWWAGHWRKGIGKMIDCEKLTGGLFQADFNWFVKIEDNLVAVIEGTWDNKSDKVDIAAIMREMEVKKC